MEQISFFAKHPELGDGELRNIIILENDNNDGPPPDTYGFMEYYCTKDGCDCRKVTILVMNSEGEIFAKIDYGWESVKYYKKWGMTKEFAQLMAEASLCLVEFQSKHADFFLMKFKWMVENDSEYKDRLERHYYMIKNDMAKNKETNKPYINNTNQVGRNDPCPCGSKKKYKKCCIKDKTNTDSGLSVSKDEKFKTEISGKYSGSMDIKIGASETEMSEIIMEFAQEIMDEAKEDEDEQSALSMAILGWNASFFSKEEQTKLIEKFCKELGTIGVKDENDFKSVMKYLIHRKRKLYPHIYRMIVEHKIKNTGKKLSLHVTSTALDSSEGQGRKLWPLFALVICGCICTYIGIYFIF